MKFGIRARAGEWFVQKKVLWWWEDQVANGCSFCTSHSSEENARATFNRLVACAERTKRKLAEKWVVVEEKTI